MIQKKCKVNRILPNISQIPLTPAKAGVAEPVLIDPSGTAVTDSVEVVENVGVVVPVVSGAVVVGVIKGLGVAP